jgi:hypothetical protein
MKIWGTTVPHYLKIYETPQNFRKLYIIQFLGKFCIHPFNEYSDWLLTKDMHGVSSRTQKVSILMSNHIFSWSLSCVFSGSALVPMGRACFSFLSVDRVYVSP